MADDVDITAGSGTTVRADEVGGIKVQVMRHDVNREGDGELLGLADTRIITAASAGLTTATTAYTAGDQLGTELTFASIVRTGKGASIISALIVDASKIIGAVDLFLFNAAVTEAADNAANSFSDADMAKCIGVLHFADVISSALNIVVLGVNLPIAVKPATSTSIFGNLVTRTGHTFFGAATDLTVVLGVVQD